MTKILDISADVFAKLASEHVGAVDLSDRMLSDKAASAFTLVGDPPTTILRTHFICF